jgi:hypothetical protein
MAAEWDTQKERARRAQKAKQLSRSGVGELRASPGTAFGRFTGLGSKSRNGKSSSRSHGGGAVSVHDRSTASSTAIEDAEWALEAGD